MVNWLYGAIPTAVDVAEHLTYFTDLVKRPDRINIHESELAPARQELYNNAKAMLLLQQQKISNDKAEKKINASLEFLRQVAQNEQKKEVNFLIHFINKVRAKFPDNKKINRFLDHLKPNYYLRSNISESFTDEFYLNLTACITAIRQEVQSTIRRLKQIKVNADGQLKFNEQVKSNILLRLSTDMDGFVRRLTNQLRRSGQNSFTEKVSNAVLDFAASVKWDPFSHYDGMSMMQFLLVILVDFEIFLDKEMTKNGKSDPLYDISKIDNDTFKKFKEKYQEMLTAGGEYETDVTRIVRTADIQLNNMMEAAGAVTNLSQNSNLTPMKNRAVHDKAVKLFTERGVSNDVMQEFFSLETKITNIDEETGRRRKNDTVHGLVGGEFTSVLQENITRILDSQNATDILTIAAGDLEIAFPESRQEIQQILDNLVQGVRQSTDEMNKTKNKVTNTARQQLDDHYKQANEALQKLLEEYDALDKKIFIIHESAKLYTSIESKSSSSFGGRKISIIKAINDLYAAGNVQIPGLPNYDLMMNIALNLSPEAVGSKNKNPLADILAQFAGILMFDDTEQMTKDIVKQLETESNTEVVHLYKLNNLFVPGSMILFYMYQHLKQGWQMFNSNQIATVNITTNSATSTIKKHVAYLEEQQKSHEPHSYIHNYPGKWRSIAEEVGIGTKVEIHFFASFLNFTTRLLGVYQ